MEVEWTPFDAPHGICQRKWAGFNVDGEWRRFGPWVPVREAEATQISGESDLRSREPEENPDYSPDVSRRAEASESPPSVSWDAVRFRRPPPRGRSSSDPGRARDD